MRKCTIVCVLIVALLTSCGADDPLSVSFVKETLNTESIITVYSNPSIHYEVSVNEQFVSLLNLDNWENVPAESVGMNIETMLYFDLRYSETAEQYSRVAVFQNGYALIQIFDGQQFRDKKWYLIHQPTDTDIFTQLYLHVTSSAIS